MTGLDLFSRRKARAEKDTPDIYKYDELPHKIRVQIIHILSKIIGEGSISDYSSSKEKVAENIYMRARDTMRLELGVFMLDSPEVKINSSLTSQFEIFNFFLVCNFDSAIDIIELFCRIMERYLSTFQFSSYSNTADDVLSAISDINFRMREGGIGYQYTDGEIIRIDSQFLHAEAVLPALQVLRLRGFEGAQSEFLRAHEHFRHARYSETLVECYKAFESTMEAIYDKRKWDYKKGASASTLIDCCMQNGLLPSYWQSHFGGLRSVLESAIPTPRNKAAAHGSGSSPIVIPEELASYVLHMTAATLLFLINADGRG